jgi:hypothetical protein
MPVTPSSLGIRSRVLHENWVARQDLSHGGLKSTKKRTLENQSFMLALALA